jgi:hypothetical protein
MMSTIYLSGGLGNQLHQLSVALGLSEGHDVKLSTVLLPDSSRTLEIQDMVENTELAITSDLCPCEKKVFPVRLASIEFMFPPCCILSYPEDSPWLAHRINPTKFHKLMANMLIKNGNLELKHEIVIHFRLGDYLWPRALFQNGVLSKKYYEKPLKKLDVAYPVIALTDDPAALGKIYGNEIANKRITSIENGTVQSDFLRMVNAKYLISGNSTLSLWALWFRENMPFVGSKSFVSFGPRFIYRKKASTFLAGIGREDPIFRNPIYLMIRFPFVFSRRLKWRGKYW